MIESRDIDCARELLEAMADAAARSPQSWDQVPIAVAANAVAVLAQAGAALPDAAPPLARVLHELQDGPGALARLPPPLLAPLHNCIRPAWAGELADLLHDEKVLPDGSRLVRLLAMSDPARADRLIADYLRTEGRNGWQWAEHVTEARLGALDAGFPVSSVVEQEFEALVADPVQETESYTARLRLAARQDARGALPLLVEAVGNVGYDSVEPGLEAVMGRLAGTDRVALARHLREATDTLDERITCFRASLWETPEPADVDRLTALTDDLEQDIASRGLFPRERDLATLELLAAAARLGAAETASRIVLFADPAESMIFEATWAPCRKRALAGEPGAISLPEQIAPAVARGAQPDRPRESWAQWRIWALPLQELPWWRPWDGGLP